MATKLDMDLVRKFMEFKGITIEEFAWERADDLSYIIANRPLNEDEKRQLLGRNRSTASTIEHKIRKEMQDAKDTADKAAYKEKIQSGAATWKQIDGAWYVLVKGDKLEPGAVIEVEKKNGSKSEVLIKSVKIDTEIGTLYKVTNI